MSAMMLLRKSWRSFPRARSALEPRLLEQQERKEIAKLSWEDEVLHTLAEDGSGRQKREILVE